MFEIFDKLPVCHDIKDSKVRTKDVVLDEEVKFSSLLLEEEIQKGLAKCGYDVLSPIQKNALPLALTGTSLIAHAKSGTGKTLIYLLTALNSYLKSKPKHLFSLILAPTREIAKQVYDVCKNISYFIKDLNVEFFIGGISLDIDVIKCKTCHIAVGAPGRIKHLIDLGELKVDRLQLLVLDEVDALVNNKEFAINEVVSKLPTSRQTIVCTATYSDSIGVLLKSISTDLKYVNMDEEENQNNAAQISNVLLGIKQYVAPVFSDSSPMDIIRKRNKLVEVLKNFKYNQCFIFVNYLSLVKSVYHFLLNSNLSVMWVSSEQNQSTRIATLNKLKMNECRILVTTDLASRGIDVHGANLVINLGVPSPPDVYMHRMGRAGRYGSEGSVITIVYEGVELDTFRELVCSVVTRPVDLHLMPREINTETLNCELQVLRCNPNPHSRVVRAFMAKHRTKMENQAEGKNKRKKNRKRKAKEKLFQENTQHSTAQVQDSSSSSDKCDLESKSVSAEFEDVKKRIVEFKINLQNEMCQRIGIDTSALTMLFQSMIRPIKKQVFVDYTEEPSEEKNDVLIQDNNLMDASWFDLAEFIRRQNKFLGEQRMPCSLNEFFMLIDHEEDPLECRSKTQTISKLTRELVEKLRDIMHIGLPPINDFVPSDNTEDSSIIRATSNWQMETNPRTSPSTSDSLGPLRKVLSSYRIPSLVPVPPPKIIKPNPLKQIGFKRFFASNMTSNPLHVNVNDTAAYNFNVPVLKIANMDSQQKLMNKPENSREQTESNHKSKSSVGEANVQCPQCQHKFVAKLDSNNSNPQSYTGMLGSLAPYVNCETEQQIYQSHFNYISNSVRKVQSNNLNN